MRDRLSLAVVVWTTLALLGAPESLAAQDRGPSPELMLFEEIPMVVTATRTARSARAGAAGASGGASIPGHDHPRQ